jgi:hypothetical protein
MVVQREAAATKTQPLLQQIARLKRTLGQKQLLVEIIIPSTIPTQAVNTLPTATWRCLLRLRFGSVLQ